MLGWLPTYFSYRIKITQNYHRLLLTPLPPHISRTFWARD